MLTLHTYTAFEGVPTMSTKVTVHITTGYPTKTVYEFKDGTGLMFLNHFAQSMLEASNVLRCEIEYHAEIVRSSLVSDVGEDEYDDGGN